MSLPDGRCTCAVLDGPVAPGCPQHDAAVLEPRILDQYEKDSNRHGPTPDGWYEDFFIEYVFPWLKAKLAARMSVTERAPVQGEIRVVRKGAPRPGHWPPGTISWGEHLEAYAAHAAKCGGGDPPGLIAHRGGFAYGELCELLGHEPTTWVENKT